MRMLVSEKISKHISKTPEGYLLCTDCILARTGKQEYKRAELFGETDDAESDNTIINVDRPYNEVFDEKTLASLEGKPIAINHPDEDITVENYKDYAVGTIRNVRKGTDDGEPVIIADLLFTDTEAIDLIESGKMKELSVGYDCDIRDDDNGQIYQHHIRANHLALCEAGRAGNARIIDSKMKDSSKVSEVAEEIFEHCLDEQFSAKEILNMIKRQDLSICDKLVRHGHSNVFDDQDEVDDFCRKNKSKLFAEIKRIFEDEAEHIFDDDELEEIGFYDSKVKDGHGILSSGQWSKVVRYAGHYEKDAEEIYKAIEKLHNQKRYLNVDNCIEKVLDNLVSGRNLLDSRLKDRSNTTVYQFRQADLDIKGSWLGTTDWGTPRGSIYVYKDNNKIIVDTKGYDNPDGRLEFYNLQELNRWLKGGKVYDSSNEYLDLIEAIDADGEKEEIKKQARKYFDKGKINHDEYNDILRRVAKMRDNRIKDNLDEDQLADLEMLADKYGYEMRKGGSIIKLIPGNHADRGRLIRELEDYDMPYDEDRNEVIILHESRIAGCSFFDSIDDKNSKYIKEDSKMKDSTLNPEFDNKMLKKIKKLNEIQNDLIKEPSRKNAKSALHALEALDKELRDWSYNLSKQDEINEVEHIREQIDSSIKSIYLQYFENRKHYEFNAKDECPCKSMNDTNSRLHGEEEAAVKSYELAMKEAKEKGDVEAIETYKHIQDEEREHVQMIQKLQNRPVKQESDVKVVNDSIKIIINDCRRQLGDAMTKDKLYRYLVNHTRGYQEDELRRITDSYFASKVVSLIKHIREKK